MKRIVRFYLFLIFWGFCNILSAQYQEVTHFLDSLAEKEHFYGIAGVKEGNQTLYFHSAGYADLETKRKHDTTTLFDIGSVSKVITGMMIVDLVEKKIISLNDNIQKYIPELKYTDITIWNLMTHTSGLPRIEPSYFKKTMLSYGKTLTNAKEITYFNKKIKKPASGTFQYSNQNYDLLAMVLERVYKKPYPKILDEYLAKYGVVNTHYASGFPRFNNVANSYLIEQSIFDFRYNYELSTYVKEFLNYGSIRIFSNFEDLTTLSNLLMTNQLGISDSFYQSDQDLVEDSRSLLFNIEKKYGVKILYHEGHFYGYNSVLAVIPEKKLTFVVLSNSENNRSETTKNYFMRVYDRLLEAYFEPPKAKK